MKRILQLIGCAAGLTMAATVSAQETDNINNRYGPPNYTGGTVASPNESYSLYQQANVNTSKVYRQSVGIMEVYPNPAATYTRVVLNGNTTEPVTLSIISMNGVLMRSYEYSAGSGRFDIDVSSLPDGIYALQVQERGKEAQSIQLSKQR